LRVFPKTGKTHQIRVHLRHAGLPLAVDQIYNPSPADREPGILLSRIKRDYRPGRGPERPLIARLTLHAHRLAFVAASGERIVLEAPIPKDFRATINQLSKLAKL
jgi:23S rRNA-/tRNA-specific pseudouridylate synthase